MDEYKNREVILQELSNIAIDRYINHRQYHYWVECDGYGLYWYKGILTRAFNPDDEYMIAYRENKQLRLIYEQLTYGC